jgi:rhombotail lipoprotein
VRSTVARLLVLSVAIAGIAACTVQQQMRSNALEYLYPSGAEAVPPTDVVLRLPAHVGLAFAPAAAPLSNVAVRGETFSENQKQQLLRRVADAFQGRKNIGAVEVIPSSYLTPGGGFAELQRLRAGFGVDYMVLVSYDQLQFSESQKSSLLYWVTYGAGAFVIKGEKNETRTLMDAVVYDIDSRRMLFHATGQSSVKGDSTLVDVSKEMRERSSESFGLATDDLITNLDAALVDFQARAKSGTVRGEGTPALTVTDRRGTVIPVGAGGGSSLGATGLALLIVAAWRRRSQRSAG